MQSITFAHHQYIHLLAENVATQLDPAAKSVLLQKLAFYVSGVVSQNIRRAAPYSRLRRDGSKFLVDLLLWEEASS